MPTYLGIHCHEHTGAVSVDGRTLCPRHDLTHHADHLIWWTPDGALQLALAILADHCASNEQRALDHYRGFRDRVVRHLPHRWTLDSHEIEAILEALEPPAREWAA